MPLKTQETEISPAESYIDALQARRRSRFAQWVNTCKSQTEAIDKLGGMNQALVSQLSKANGKKAFGEKLAREIEHRAGLKFGWLDADDEDEKSSKGIPQDSLTKKLLTIWTQLAYGEKRELVGMAAVLLRRPQDAA